MKVSIVTPIHNSENTIRETAESVIGQNHIDWEWLLFNDGSTDKSLQIVEQLQEKDSRISLIGQSEKSMGPSYGRNRCIEKSKGEIIAFLDADDLWQSQYLNQRIKAHSDFPEAAMIYGPAIYFGDSEQFLQNTGFHESKLFKPGELILHFMGNIKGTPITSGVTLKREVFNKTIAFPEELRRGEDIALFLLVNQFFSIYYDAIPVLKYRRHTASSTSKAHQAGVLHDMDWFFYKWLLDFSRRTGSKKIEGMGNKVYYEHTISVVRQIRPGYIKSRQSIYRNLQEVKLPKFFSLFFLLDCVVPLKFSKKIRARTYLMFKY
jgi:glycosyltransferase involved in cell wall biosynthesis